jgi:hypothetical protein
VTSALTSANVLSRRLAAIARLHLVQIAVHQSILVGGRDLVLQTIAGKLHCEVCRVLDELTFREPQL